MAGIFSGIWEWICDTYKKAKEALKSFFEGSQVRFPSSQKRETRDENGAGKLLLTQFQSNLCCLHHSKHACTNPACRKVAKPQRNKIADRYGEKRIGGEYKEKKDNREA